MTAGLTAAFHLSGCQRTAAAPSCLLPLLLLCASLVGGVLSQSRRGGGGSLTGSGDCPPPVGQFITLNNRNRQTF